MNRTITNTGRRVGLMAVCLLATLVSGCGKKGDLFLPEEKSAVRSTPAAQPAPVTSPQADSEKEQTNRKQDKPAE